MIRAEFVKIGTSGYSYPGAPPKGWYGLFYPKHKGRSFDDLEYYSSFFNTVEINSTFYRPSSLGMAEAWARKTPADFEFAVKVWQKFTHPMKLGEGAGQTQEEWERPTDADVDIFKSSVEALANSGKLGILLFQYPPSFHYTKENAERLYWTLKAFKDYQKAVELRHRSWSNRGGEVRVLLEQLGATWAVIDEPKFSSSVRQTFEPIGEIFYLRLHGRNQKKWWSHEQVWERYDYFYGPDEIRLFGEKISAMAQRSSRAKIYVFFNNHARGQAVANGFMLKREVGQVIPGGVPTALVEAYPHLAGLAALVGQETLF